MGDRKNTKIEFTDGFRSLENQALVVGVDSNGNLLMSAPAHPEFQHALLDLIASQFGSGRFRARIGDTLNLTLSMEGKAVSVLACGLGVPARLTLRAVRQIGGSMTAALRTLYYSSAVVSISRPKESPVDSTSWTANLAFGALLRNYAFTRYLDEQENHAPSCVERFSFLCRQLEQTRMVFERLSAVAQGIYLARDLTHEPPNILFPESFVRRAKCLEPHGVKVSNLAPPAMEKLGMNALLAVGGGSRHSPRLLTTQWIGTSNPNALKIAFVGKGITFDSGGLDIKKLENMIHMKGDMAAGAAVVGAVYALAKQKAEVSVIGAVALAENAVSGSAYRPSDIIRAANGKTVEITSPDAEGRLVLLDAIWYICKEYRPDVVISLGTLSGSAISGLGRYYAGLYTEDDRLAESIKRAGEAADEPLWRLPMNADYDNDIVGDISDLKLQADFKCGADGTYCARLLRHSVDASSWGHIEMTWLEGSNKDSHLCPKGMTGYATGTLEALAHTIQ